MQSAFFAAYFVFSLPAAGIVRRIGYIRAAALGLVTMTVGCVLFIPASALGTFGIFLFALFVVAAGITIVQVVANPLVSMLGPESTAHSRLTFAQGFNNAVNSDAGRAYQTPFQHLFAIEEVPMV